MRAAQMAVVMNQVLAACWTCLLLSAVLFQPVLCKGGRGGSRGSSRGSPSRSSTAGSYRAGGIRSRFKVAGRTSPAVRVAAAAAAGAAVALTADKWYASAYRHSNEKGYYNRTSYFDAQMSGAIQNVPLLTQVLSVFTAILYPTYSI